MPRSKNYTLGAGKLYFDRFDEDGNSTGELYIGNTTSLTGSFDESREEHYSSDEAERAKDASVVTQSDQSVGFTTDDIQPENLALLWKGTSELLAVGAVSSHTENVGPVIPGRWYQLGAGLATPTGARSVTVTAVTDDAGSPVAIPGGDDGVNYKIDEELGRIFVKEDATGIVEGDIIKVTWSGAAHSREVILSKGETIKGSLRYIADNTAGKNRDDFWPLVDLSPDGDFEFKADSWTEMSFTGEVLKKEGYEKHYVDGRPVV